MRETWIYLRDMFRDAFRVLVTGRIDTPDGPLPVPRGEGVWWSFSGGFRVAFIWSALGLILFGVTVLWTLWYPQYFPWH